MRAVGSKGRTATLSVAAAVVLLAFAAEAACGTSDTGRGDVPDASGDETSATDGAPDASTIDARVIDATAKDATTRDAIADAAFDGSDADVPPCVTPVVPPLKLTPVMSGGATISAAVFALQAPGSDDWYVVGLGGTISIVRGGVPLTPPFLDVSKGIGSGLGERGLLSVAFHPSYAQNGRFFVMLTPSDDADGSLAPADVDTVLEFARDPMDPDHAIATKVRDLVTLPASAPNHNGGTIRFGPDGYLYVGTGDGGAGCATPITQTQQVDNLFGKILRLDVDGTAPYAVATNPFATDKRIFHYGLRNPFRWNFDSLTGDMYIGDVGESSYEEIDFVPAGTSGLNFGWNAYEGNVAGTCGADKIIGGPSAYTPPMIAIDRTMTSTSDFADYQAIIGGAVYRGTAMHDLRGALVFADFYGKELGFLRRCNGAVHGPIAIKTSDVQVAGGLYDISAIVEGHDHELYVSHGFGSLSKLEPQ